MTDSAFVGSIPDIYERYLGGLLFEPYARDLARRFEGFEGDILETAAGTGRVTRALAKAAPTARIIATDLNQPMLDTAAALTAAANVAWRQADAQALPFGDASFDAVVCQFGVMFFPDKAAGYAQARRVLRPGGRLVFNVWDDIAENQISKLVSDTVAGLFPKDPPQFLERTPFGYHDHAAIAAALNQAGFGAPQFDVVRLEMRSPSAADAATGLCTGTPLRGEIEARDPDALEAATEAATAALTEAFGGGEIVGYGRAVVVTAGVS